MKDEKISPALAALMFEYLKFPDVFSADRFRPQVIAVSPRNLPEAAVLIDCDEKASFENLTGVRLVSGNGKNRTAQIELAQISDLSERNDVRFLSCAMKFEPLNDSEAAENGGESADKTRKTIIIAPNKFAPARFNFVVPSNALPGSPPEVVLYGRFETGDGEIMIMSPNGGVTRSTQAEILAGNPTRFGNYSSSQAFLTKPIVLPNGSREFFIDLRPIAPKEVVIGGTWRLTVTNVGNTAMTVSISTAVPENAESVEFV